MTDIEQRINIIPEGFRETAQQADQLRAKFNAFFQEVERSRNTRAGANNLVRQMEETRKSVRGAVEEAGRLRREFERVDTPKLLTLAQAEAKETIVDLERVQSTVRDLRQELNTLPEASVAAPRVNPRGGGGRAVQGAPTSLNDRTFGQLAGAANQFGLPGANVLNFAAGVADVTENLPKLAAEIREVGLAGLGATAAVGAFAAIFLATKKAAEDATKPIDNFVAGMPEIGAVTADLYTIFKEGSSESVAAIRQEAELREQLIEAQRDQAQALVNQTNAALEANFGSVGGKALQLLGFNAGAAEDSVEELNTQLREQDALLQVLSSDYVQSQVAINDFISGLDQARAAQQELTTLITTGTTQQVEAEKARLQIQLDGAAQEKTAIEGKIAELVRANEAQFGQIVDSGIDTLSELRDYAVNVLGASTEAVNTDDKLLAFLRALTGGGEAFDTLTQKFIDLDQEVQTTTDSITELDQVAAPRVARLEQEAELIERVNELSEERTKLLEDQAKIDDQIADLEADRARTLAIREEDAALKALHASELDAIDARIEEAKAMDAQRAQQQKIASLQNERNNRAAEIDTKFFNDTLKLVTEARKEETRITRDEGIKRLRFLQDLERDLFELAASRDTSGFLSRLRQGTTDLPRSDEDSDLAAADRRDALRQQLDEAQAARDEELVQLEQHYQERLAAEASGQRKVITLVEQLQQEREAIRARQQAEVDLIRQQREAQAHQERLAALNRQREELQGQLSALDRQLVQNAGTLAFNFGTASLNALSQAAVQHLQTFMPQIQAMLTGFLPNFVRPQQLPTLPGSNPLSPRQILRNQHGGIYRHRDNGPQLIQVAEEPGVADAVIGFQESEGFPQAARRMFGGDLGDSGFARGGGLSRGGNTYHILEGATFGSEITRADLDRFGEQIASEIGEGFRAGIGRVA